MKPFVQAFVRPHGLDVAATPLFVEQVEAMAGLKMPAARPDVLAFFWRRAMARLRALRHDERFDRWVLSEREQTVKMRNQQARELKARERRDARRAREAAEKDGVAVAGSW